MHNLGGIWHSKRVSGKVTEHIVERIAQQSKNSTDVISWRVLTDLTKGIGKSFLKSPPNKIFTYGNCKSLPVTYVVLQRLSTVSFSSHLSSKSGFQGYPCKLFRLLSVPYQMIRHSNCPHCQAVSIKWHASSRQFQAAHFHNFPLKLSLNASWSPKMVTSNSSKHDILITFPYKLSILECASVWDCP